MTRTPLSILDLSPVPAGGTARDAVRNSVELAQKAEAAGFHRYWLAEHHIATGVASSATAVLIGQVAAATSRIRVGAGAIQLGHHTALSVAEEFGTLAAFYPGRIDLGLGRSGHRKPPPPGVKIPEPPKQEPKVIDGLLVPGPFPIGRAARSGKLALENSLLHLPGSTPVDYADSVHDILAFLAGTYKSGDCVQAHAVPGEGADVQPWILGSSGGESAILAGKLGLPFAAAYHVAPAGVLAAIDAYRSAFRPSQWLSEPYVVVSADVVVARETDAKAAELAAPYGLWVLAIRSGKGARSYPSAAEAAAYNWTDEDRELVTDRVDTQLVGSPATVAAKLAVVRAATGADELLITTITYDHADRVRSHQLIAEEWLG
ncbi:LLM class flavin-dependent oxidoreductase [Fodinicola feengrottensis]|uniref:LLM class flavin-dependent oxidoreductase n=1 Tax=Fodinicola feengrottensis TaxID=435914 RepID=UPI0013D2A575|nr:LLM class flavin-dependent oxidoreductase [Fodinicola feengrottensis]